MAAEDGERQSGHPRRVQIAVIGGSTCSADIAALAEQVGVEIGRRGATLICGGLGGVMEAAARGACRGGGLTVGVLPSYDPRTANPWVDVRIPTGFSHGRNIIVVAGGDAVIALAGEHGTASEIALALTLGRAVIALNAWPDYAGVAQTHSPQEAVELAIAVAMASRPHGNSVAHS
jgi:uncharacterized protein (TIGR00725 family)